MTNQVRGTCRLALGGLVLLLAAGCGRRGPEVVPVAGTVTYGHGAWPKPGMLYFTPIQAAEGLPLRPGYAELAADGSFRATSFAPGDGLVPGSYHVGIECWQHQPVMGSREPLKSCVPPRYQSPATSPLQLTVRPGQGKVSVQWDVPPP